MISLYHFEINVIRSHLEKCLKMAASLQQIPQTKVMSHRPLKIKFVNI